MDYEKRRLEAKRIKSRERCRRYRARKRENGDREPVRKRKRTYASAEDEQRAKAASADRSRRYRDKKKRDRHDNIMAAELNDYLRNTPFPSSVSEQEKIELFYQLKEDEAQEQKNKRAKAASADRSQKYRDKKRRERDDLRPAELEDYLRKTQFPSSLSEREKIEMFFENMCFNLL